MAKKKQEYSTESVDEMVERLKRSYESADLSEGEDADPAADDEAFAKMLVEMFGKQGKSRAASEPKRTELYSAEDFMTLEDATEAVTPAEADEAQPLALAQEPLEELADAEQIKEQIKQTAQAQIVEQLQREQAQADVPEDAQEVIPEDAQEVIPEDAQAETEQVPREELPWFDGDFEDELDEEDAAEIAEYEALVAQDELEQLLDFDEIPEDELDEIFEDEDELAEIPEDEDELDEIPEWDELAEIPEDEDELDEIPEDELAEIPENELAEIPENEDELDEIPERDELDEIPEDEDELDEIPEDEDELDEIFETDELDGTFESEDVTESSWEDAYIEESAAEPEDDYVEQLFDSLEGWKKSVAAIKEQTRAEKQTEEREVRPKARRDAELTVAQPEMTATKPVPQTEPRMRMPEEMAAAVPEVTQGKAHSDEIPDYPENDPMQGRVAIPVPVADKADAEVAFENQDAYAAAVLSEQTQTAARGRRKAFSRCFAWRGKEYLAESEEAEIKQAYEREKPWAIVRLAVCAVLLFSLIALDNAYLLNYLQGSVPTLITTPVYPLIAAMAVLLACAFCGRRLWDGLRSTFTRTPSRYAVPAVMLLFALAHDILLAGLAGRQYMMFNSLAVLALTLCTVADVLDLHTQERNFQLIRSGKPRYGVEKVADAAAQSRLPVAAGEAEQPIGPGAYRVRELRFVNGYFRRTSASAEHKAALPLLYGVALAGAVVAAIAGYAATGQGMSALNAFMICVMCAMPLSMLLFGAIPAFVAGKTLAESGCAVIGVEAADEYRDAKALLFDAGQMFTAYGSSQITVRGDSDIGIYMDKTRVLLNALGGTLADIAGGEQPGDPDQVKIEMMSVAENGLTLYMNGVTCVMMGDYDYLAARGVRLPRRENETNYKKRKNSAVIYLAFDGVFRVGYSVDYEMRREFLLRAKQLQAEGIDPVIVTYDPCINRQTMLARAKDAGIAVERQREYEGASCQKALDCGVIATRAPEDVLLPLLACRKLRLVRIFGLVLRYIYLALSLAVVLLLSVLGHIGYAWPLLLLLYQLLWLLVIPVVCTGLLGDLRNKK